MKSGEEIHRARVPDVGSGFSASPVAADGKLYLANEDGAIAVVAAGRAFRHIATNDMGEPVMATPALSRGIMFVRGMRSLSAAGRRIPRGLLGPMTLTKRPIPHPAMGPEHAAWT